MSNPGLRPSPPAGRLSALTLYALLGVGCASISEAGEPTDAGKAPVPLGPPLACDTRDAVAAALQGEYGERVTGAGLDGRGFIVELYRAESSWSLVLRFPNGRACLVGSGEFWSDVPAPETPGTGS